MISARWPALLVCILAGFLAACDMGPRPTPAPEAAPALSGSTLTRTLEDRFGIWFVGEPFPASISMALPAEATAPEATEALYRAFERQSDFYVRVVSNSSYRSIFQIWRAQGDLPTFRYGNNPTDVPFSDEVVTQIFPLQWPYDSTARFSIAGPTAKLTALESHHCVLITDSSSNIHRMLETLARFQPPIAEHHVVEYRQLIFLNAPEVARDINRRQNLPPDTTAAAAQAKTTGSLYADADPRTNVVILNGPANDVSWVVDRMNRMEDAVEQARLSRLEAVRPDITTPLAGAALVQEFEVRYGIWFVGAKELPSQLTLKLPEREPALWAVDLLRDTLERGNSGFQLTEVAGVPDFSLYVLRPIGEKPQSYFFGSDPDYIPLTDDLIAQIIPLKNESAVHFLEDFKSVISADAKFTPLDSHRCIMITDTSARIHRLLAMKHNIENERVMQIPVDRIPLKYANAAVVAKAVNTNFAPPPQPPSIGPAMLTDTLYADVDPKTNTVITSGPSDQMQQAHDLILQLESTAEKIVTSPRDFAREVDPEPQPQ